MDTIDRIRLTLEPPKHGWLPTKLELGDFVVDDVASGVLNDPIEEFLEALAYCQNPTSAGNRICLWMEPGGYAIDIVASSTSDRCVLRVSFHGDFIPPMRGKEMKVEFEAEADTIRVSRAISAAFGELLRPVHQRALDDWGSRQTYLQRFTELRNAHRAKRPR